MRRVFLPQTCYLLRSPSLPPSRDCLLPAGLCAATQLPPLTHLQTDCPSRWPRSGEKRQQVLLTNALVSICSSSLWEGWEAEIKEGALVFGRQNPDP